MSLFTLDIAEILSGPTGTMQSFHFEQLLADNAFASVTCTTGLVMDIKLVRQDYGIECLIISLETTIDIPEEYIEWKEVSLSNQSREFHLKKLEKDTDDIQYINIHDVTIDLSQAIEEELLIAGLL